MLIIVTLMTGKKPVVAVFLVYQTSLRYTYSLPENQDCFSVYVVDLVLHADSFPRADEDEGQTKSWRVL
jgi:hypothetical protein